MPPQRRGVYPVGSKLPSIAALMRDFDVKGLNTVRDAQQMLVNEGLLRPEQGVGVWVIAASDKTPTSLQILDDLRRAQSALGRVIAQFEELNHV
ncbi:MAG: GntR family transcriptional regulator [Propionibacteriaceae bacterium]